MKPNKKLLLLTFLSVCFLLHMPGLKAEAASAVPINSDTFPDDAFRAYLLDNPFDRDHDGALNEYELENAESLDIDAAAYQIYDFTGVEHLYNLNSIRYENGCLSGELDLSDLHNLEWLYVSNNNLTEVILSDKASFWTIDVRFNNMNSMDDVKGVVKTSNTYISFYPQGEKIEPALTSEFFPDEVFRNELKKYDSNENGILEMDGEISSIGYFNEADTAGIDNFEGIQYLVYLENLKITDAKHGITDQLPHGLRGFDFEDAGLKTLPELPETLMEFRGSHNKLTTIPELPAGIVHLQLDHNNLSGVQDFSKYKNLTIIELHENKISGIVLADDVQYEIIHIARNGMKSLDDVVGADWIKWDEDNGVNFHFSPQRSICEIEGHLLTSYKWGSKPGPYNAGYKYRECSSCDFGYEEITFPQVTSIKLSATTYTYNGSVKTPTVTVKDSKGTLLKKDTDYTVEYEPGRKNVGTYDVTIRFKGNYADTIKKTFKIVKATQKITASNKTLKVGGSTVKLGAKRTTGNGTLTYSSSNSKVATVSSTGVITAKGAGKATITITAKETTNYKKTTKTVTVTVYPKATSVSSLKAGKKQMTVKWYKRDNITGYEVRYSRNSSMSGAKTVKVTSSKTTSKVIKGLTAQKKYYVQVRTYKTVNGGKYPSGWSAKKSVTVKK